MANYFDPQQQYEDLVVSKLTKLARDGEGMLQKEDTWQMMPKCYSYWKGKQGMLKSSAISRVVNNRLKRGLYEVVSALTDVRQIWNYKAGDIKLKDQENILNKLAPAWWLNTRGDRALASAVLDAHIATSYIHLKFNPDLPGGGDVEMLPVMAKDVIPIGPTYGESIQEWGGVIVRSVVNAETLKELYPAKAKQIEMAKGSTFYGQDLKETDGSVQTPTPLDRWMGGSVPTKRSAPGTVEILTAYYRDGAKNLSEEDVLMGEGTRAEYKVPPGKMLYPRGRCTTIIVGALLADGPNPYWHGKYPVVRLCLEPISETLLGASCLGQLISMQDGLNEAIRGYEDAIKLWIRRGIVVDSRSAAGANLKAIDTRKEGMQIRLNPNGGTEGFKLIDGPNLPTMFMQMIEFYIDQIDDHLGVKDLKQLQGSRNSATNDTIQRYEESLNPVLRFKARAIEVALSEIAELMMVNFFQYYTAGRRMQMLGTDGVTISDFDYDPLTLVPAPDPNDSRDRTTRGMEHYKNFSFVVAPGTFLEVSNTQRKMFILQLYREGKVDPWTTFDALGITNMGPTPTTSIPERIDQAKKLGLLEGPTVEMVKMNQDLQLVQLQLQIQQLEMQKQQMAAQMAQVKLAGNGPPQEGGPEGPGGPPQEGGPPQGGSPSGPPPQGMEGPKRVGRPPSGQQPPQMIMKDNGTRMVVSESGR